MLKSRKNRKRVLIVVGSILAIIIANLILSSVIESKITELLANNESDYYKISVGKPKFKLLQQSIEIKNIELAAKINIEDSLEGKKPSIADVKLASIKLQGFGLLQLIWNNEIDINNLEINGLHIINSNAEKPSDDKEVAKPFDINAIPIKKFNGFEIDNIAINDFRYEVIDAKTKETTFITESISFKTDGFKLEKYQDNLFKLLPIDDSLSISDVNFKMNEKHYRFSLNKIKVDFKESTITLNQLEFKPLIPKKELANLYTFCDDVFDVEMEELTIHYLQLDRLLKKEGVFIDSISVKGLNLEMYKDKRHPFNESKYVNLPHISLRHSKTPISIVKLKVSNSNISIEERPKESDTLMSVVLANTNLRVQNITSIDSLRQNPMVLDITADLMQKAPMTVHAEFSLKNDSFNFNGHLGTAELNLFDSALFPVVGLKVLSGKLNNLKFSAYANNTESKGQMTLLYNSLEARVFKKNSFQTNKFLSWSVNSLVKKSNPKKNKPARVASMQFERDTYKGIGNFMWKTILNGITNTLAPGGKLVKPNKKKEKG